MAFQLLNHDDMPLYTQYLLVGQVGHNGRLNPNAERLRAAHPGSEFVQIVKDRRDPKTGRVTKTDAQQIALYEGGWRTGGQSSASSGAGGGATPAGNALQKQYTGGGEGVDVGVGQQRSVTSQIQGAFLGMTLNVADTKVPPGKSPDCLNVDGLAIDGAVGPRFGLIQATPRRYEFEDPSVFSLTTAFKGRSINVLSQAFWQSGVPTAIITYDKSLIGAVGASYTRTISRPQRTGWNPQFPIDRVAPQIRFITGSGGSLNFSVAMPERFRRNVANGVVASVDEIVVRVSTISFPRDIDGREYASSAASQITGQATALVSTAGQAFNGSSTTFNQSGLTPSQVRFYTVWAKSKEHITEPAYFRYTVV